MLGVEVSILGELKEQQNISVVECDQLLRKGLEHNFVYTCRNLTAFLLRNW